MTEESCKHECPKCGLMFDHLIYKPDLPRCDNKDYFMNCGMCMIKAEMER